MVPWTELAPGLLATLGLPLEAVRGARVLDAGCGTGEFARSFARLGAHVTAVDFSKGPLNVARAIDRDVGISGVEYLQLDLLDLPDIGSFDYIFSLGILHHTADPARGFRALAARLRPRGYLTVGLYSSVSRAHILALRRFLRIISRDDQERAINIAQRWFRLFLSLFVGQANADDRARVADLLANVHELPISLHHALDWFARAALDVVACSPSCSLADYPILARLVRRPTSRLAYFLILLQWLLWNADYCVIAGRALAEEVPAVLRLAQRSRSLSRVVSPAIRRPGWLGGFERHVTGLRDGEGPEELAVYTLAARRT